MGLDPRIGSGLNGADGDPDGDGLSNFQEWAHGANPHSSDSDGDGTTDGTETNQGSLPNDGGDGGQPPSEDEKLEMKIIVGDPSGSHSERWRVEVSDLATGQVVLNHASREFGELSPESESIFNQFRKGKAYKFKLVWVATDPNKLEEDPDGEFYPDYDWALEVSVKNDEGAWLNVKDESSSRFVVLDPWDPSSNMIAENNVHLLVNRSELQYPWEGQPDRTQQYQEQIAAKRVMLLPVDIDVIHPASGELAEDKEDKNDGGYVSIRRMSENEDLAPVTKLVIRAISGAQSGWKTRLKFTPGDRYKVYKNEGRTEEVTSEQTEFDATQETTLYFQGLKKSQSRGGEEITMQVGIGGQWSDGDSVKCTVVQSEFQFQVKAFIPYAWTDPEPGWQTELVMGGKVAKGDNRNFVNAYSDRTHGYATASFRVMQKVTLTPYEELHGTPDLQNERQAEPGLISEHYEKATSVDPSELHLTYGSKPPTGTAVSGPPEIKDEDYRNSTRASKSSSITIEAGAVDGALPAFARATGARIDWVLSFTIDVSADPLLPNVSFSGWHDRYPAYEIIVIESNGDFKDIHRHSPSAGDRPGPTSLDDANAVTVGRLDTISN